MKIRELYHMTARLACFWLVTPACFYPVLEINWRELGSTSQVRYGLN